MFRKEKYLKDDDPEFIFNFIQQHPFANFIIKGDELLATHIPILTEGKAGDFYLYGHIADSNEQWPHLKDDIEALLIFNGPDIYVSSSWYNHKNISTWDYTAVHINVKLKIQTQEELTESLRKLVFHFEKGRKDPQFFEGLPEDMVKDHIKQIMGFWCYPYKIQAIAKLHQGFEKEDILSVTRHLDEKNDPVAHMVSNDIKKEHGTDH